MYVKKQQQIHDCLKLDSNDTYVKQDIINRLAGCPTVHPHKLNYKRDFLKSKFFVKQLKNITWGNETLSFWRILK